MWGSPSTKVYDSCNGNGTYCSLITGQERREVPFARHVSCTVEMANVDEPVEARSGSPRACLSSLSDCNHDALRSSADSRAAPLSVVCARSQCLRMECHPVYALLRCCRWR